MLSVGLSGTQGTCIGPGLPAVARRATWQGIAGEPLEGFAKGKARTCEEAHKENLPCSQPSRTSYQLKSQSCFFFHQKGILIVMGSKILLKDILKTSKFMTTDRYKMIVLNIVFNSFLSERTRKMLYEV